MTDCAFPSLRRDGITLVFGLGETGVAAARWCLRLGGAVRVVDTRAQPPGAQQLAGVDDARLHTCYAHADWTPAGVAALCQDVHTLVLSPGIDPADTQAAALLAAAAAQGVDIVGEMELFARALADLRDAGYTPRVLAVTGTNGKTTVTAMTRHMLEAAGVSACAAGNISPAALRALADALDNQAQCPLPAVWVLELSSFQLETTRSLAPDAAVVLNISQDHLDRHGSLDDYAAVKARVFHQAKVKVIHRDDVRVAAMVPDVSAPDVRSFGVGAPALAGDAGLVHDGGVQWLALACADSGEPAAAPSGRRRKDVVAPARPLGHLMRLMPVDAMRLRGQHQALNALAALLLAEVGGAARGAALHGLRLYAGEPHRCEFVREIAGVAFINDSKGTNVGSTVAALQGMGAPVVLIAGGLGKGQDFSVLRQPVGEHARAVVLIGADAAALEAALADTGLPVIHAADMDAAVAHAFELAQAGDVVLLSPACASMDMFKNYGHRGQVFVDAVRTLAVDQGEVA